MPKQSQATPKGQAAARNAPAAPKPKDTSAQRPAQASGKTAQSPTQTASQPVTKTRATSAPKAETPAAPKSSTPAPKPRDPSVVRRDERRLERRLEIQARQQERRLELRQAKRQKILIRYDLIIAPILLIGLVAFFSVTNHPIDALISGLIVVFAGFTLLAYAAFMPTTRIRRPARSRPAALPEGAVIDSTASPGALPPDEQAEEQVASQSPEQPDSQ